MPDCNNVAINAAINCEVRSTAVSPEVLSVEGYNAVTFEIWYDWVAGSGIQFNMQACNEGYGATSCTDATDWFTIQTLGIVVGTGTLTDLLIYKAAAADIRFTYSVGLNYKRFRLANILATGAPGATDKVTIKARLSVSPAL